MRIVDKIGILALVLCSSACGGSAAAKREAAAEESATLMEKFVSTLEGIKDEASAKSAAPGLEKTIARLIELKKDMAAMERPPEAENKALQAKYEERMKSTMTRMMPAMMKIAGDEKIQAVLAPVMEKFQEVGK